MGARIPSDHTGLVPAAKNSFKTSKSPFRRCERLAAGAGWAGGQRQEGPSPRLLPALAWPFFPAHYGNFLVAFPELTARCRSHQGGFSHEDRDPALCHRLPFPRLLPASLKAGWVFFLLPLPIPSNVLLAGNIPGTYNPRDLRRDGGVRDAGSPDGAEHLLVALGSFAKRGGWPGPWEVF